jgi:hypothetical protein
MEAYVSSMYFSFYFVKENGKKEKSCSNLSMATLDGSTAAPNGSGTQPVYSLYADIN